MVAESHYRRVGGSSAPPSGVRAMNPVATTIRGSPATPRPLTPVHPGAAGGSWPRLLSRVLEVPPGEALVADGVPRVHLRS